MQQLVISYKKIKLYIYINFENILFLILLPQILNYNIF